MTRQFEGRENLIRPDRPSRQIGIYEIASARRHDLQRLDRHLCLRLGFVCVKSFLKRDMASFGRCQNVALDSRDKSSIFRNAACWKTLTPVPQMLNVDNGPRKECHGLWPESTPVGDGSEYDGATTPERGARRRRQKAVRPTSPSHRVAAELSFTGRRDYSLKLRSSVRQCR